MKGVIELNLIFQASLNSDMVILELIIYLYTV